MPCVSWAALLGIQNEALVVFREGQSDCLLSEAKVYG